MSVIFVRKESDDPILLVAEKMEPKLRTAFLHAVKTLSDQVSTDELVQAIQTGDVNKAMALLAIDQKFTDALNGKGQEQNIQSFRDALQATFAAGATVAGEQLPSSIGMNLSFNLMNPETVSFLEQYTFPLIRQISSNTADAIRDVLIDAFKNGGHPYEQARKIKQFIGLTSTQSQAVINYRNSLSSSNTLNQSLQRALRDGRFDPSVRRAIRNNTGLSQSLVDKMVKRYQERYIQYRAQSISRSESVRASNKGQRALWKQAQQQGLIGRNILRRWIASGDSDTCEDCIAVDGMEVGLDEEFAPGVMDPGDMHTDDRCGQALVFPKAA